MEVLKVTHLRVPAAQVVEFNGKIIWFKRQIQFEGLQLLVIRFTVEQYVYFLEHHQRVGGPWGGEGVILVCTASDYTDPWWMWI